MDALNNAANAASRAIFGGNEDKTQKEAQSGREPVSGVTGTGTASEPYDAGNTEGNPALGGAAASNLQSHSGIHLQQGYQATSEADSYGASSLGGTDPTTTTSTSTSTTTPADAAGREYSTTSNVTGSNLGQGNSTYGADQSSTYDTPVTHSTYTANRLDPRSGSHPEGSSSVGDDRSGSSFGVTNVGSASEPPSDYDRIGTSNTADTSYQAQPSAGSYDSTRQSSTTTGGETDINRLGSSSTHLTSQSHTTSGQSSGTPQRSVSPGHHMPRSDAGPKRETDKTGVSGLHSNDPKFAQEHSNIGSVAVSGTTSGTAGGDGTVEPSVGADPSSGQKPTPKQQGADRPLESPGDEGADAVREKKEAAERVAGGEDHSGEPLGQRKEAHEAGPNNTNPNKGTGEKWVKSTGLAADGGDFDAAKPGAGKEADRLLEEKGVQRSAGPGKADSTTTVDPTDKPGIGEKIKDKFLAAGHR